MPTSLDFQAFLIEVRVTAVRMEPVLIHFVLVPL